MTAQRFVSELADRKVQSDAIIACGHPAVSNTDAYAAAFSLWEPTLAWRIMFGLGLLPALLILYVRRSVVEPPRALSAKARPGFMEALLGIFATGTLRATLVGGLFGLGAHGGFYALFTWLPTFLRTERGLSVMGTGSYLAVIITGFGIGCLTAGQLLDRLGRRRTVAVFALGCIAVTIAYTALPIGQDAMLILSFPLGFFAAGIPASMGALFNELYPTGVRGTGVGFCYNAGRVLAAGLPPLIGWISESQGLGFAIGLNATLAYALVLVALLFLPETRGAALDADAVAS